VLLRCVYSADLKDSYEATMTDLRSQLKARTDKLNGMMEAAAQSAAQIDDLKTQLEAAYVDAGELEELRELKDDIERKEKQQAAIIENQVGHSHTRTDCAAASQGHLRSNFWCSSHAHASGMHNSVTCCACDTAYMSPLWMRLVCMITAVLTNNTARCVPRNVWCCRRSAWRSWIGCTVRRWCHASGRTMHCR
jgi:hypothetical protein